MLVFHHIQCGLPQTEEFILYTGDGLTSAQEPHLIHIYFSVSLQFQRHGFLCFSHTCGVPMGERGKKKGKLVSGSLGNYSQDLPYHETQTQG